MKKEDIALLVIVLFVIIFCFMGVYQKVTTGCFFYDKKETIKFSLVKDYNYTCKQLENMLIFEVYPHNLNSTETHFYCRGKALNYDEHTLISFNNVKEDYQENCLFRRLK